MVMGNTANAEAPLRSGQLAHLAGLSPDSLRHYERVGVLPRPQRTPAGYRLYPPGALERVRMIRRALSVGFALAELARIFRVRERGEVPCRHVRALGEKKLADVEQRLRELTALRAQLRSILRDWDRRLARNPKNRLVGLLEALPESPSPTTTKIIRRKRRFQLP